MTDECNLVTILNEIFIYFFVNRRLRKTFTVKKILSFFIQVWSSVLTSKLASEVINLLIEQNIRKVHSIS